MGSRRWCLQDGKSIVPPVPTRLSWLSLDEFVGYYFTIAPARGILPLSQLHPPVSDSPDRSVLDFAVSFVR